MKNDVAIAYVELDEILNLMNSKYTEKIPKRFKDFLSREKEENYTNKINVNKPLEEQNLQRKTLVLLAVLKLNYWCENEVEKQKFLNELNENQKEQIEKYNTYNIFIKNKKEDKVEISQIIEYKEKNIIKKIIEKIKNIFGRK
ncbi:MAG: hypothetical protein J6D03_11215 [Clostridia bacterium]|nr:hypothetical protein [Clostridia bacterium]